MRIPVLSVENADKGGVRGPTVSPETFVMKRGLSTPASTEAYAYAQDDSVVERCDSKKRSTASRISTSLWDS